MIYWARIQNVIFLPWRKITLSNRVQYIVLFRLAREGKAELRDIDRMHGATFSGQDA